MSEREDLNNGWYITHRSSGTILMSPSGDMAISFLPGSGTVHTHECLDVPPAYVWRMAQMQMKIMAMSEGVGARIEDVSRLIPASRPKIKPERLRDAAARFDFRALLEEDGCAFRASSSSVLAAEACPFCDAPGGKFRIDLNRRRTHCFECGQHGDVYTYLMRTRGVTFEEAFAYVDGWVAPTGKTS